MRAPILAALLVSLPALAAADEPAPTAVAAEAPVAQAVPELAPSELGRHEDPHSDRLLLLPSGETLPARSLTVSVGSNVFANLGMTYALTDNFQISGQMMLPLEGLVPYMWTGTAKWRFLHTDRLRVAAQAKYRFIDLDVFEESDGRGELTAGLATSVCIDRSCRSMASASVELSGVPGTDGSGLIFGGGVTARMAEHLKLVGEATSSAYYSDYDGGFEHSDAAIVAGSLRLFGQHFAADLGLVQVIYTGDEPGIAQPDPMAFVNLTYRR